MAAAPGKTFIVEHLDPELGPWSELEYLAIARETQATQGSFILSSLPPTFKVPTDLASNPAFTAEQRGVEELYAANKSKVCLLDPSAAKDLSPEDGDTFDAFLFGGILELRKKGFEGRRLGPKQMTTDTAVRVTRIVVQDKVPVDQVPYLDFPELKFNEHESTEMPFRYVKGEDGKPIMPKKYLMMLSYLTKSRWLLGQNISQWRRCFSQSTSRRSSNPLRILFCGSDEFSCASLKAVHEEQSRNKGLIESLEVMALPPKRTGRGFSSLKQGKSRIDKLPDGTNLVIAVSFGLFVPPRVLRSAKYGGLNVHPSLLPEGSLRGPAPIHHAILRGDSHIGVSLQTLDDKSFDHGTVLSQTPRPGIPVPPSCTVQELTDLLAPVGAQMLVQGLRDGLYIPPHQNKGWKGEELDPGQLVHAPKVSKADGHIGWSSWTADDIVRAMRVMGSVWTEAVSSKGVMKRLIFQDAEIMNLGDIKTDGTTVRFIEGHGPDSFNALVSEQGDGSCAIRTSDEKAIRVKKIKVEGKPERWADVALKPYIEV
ncbi:methionyl-trna formyltransferase [Fusarium longipes]|uniref:methionyl-tRNA formyltransferase n=1 Tax=Fusarium longipes TaxID=694270 RepID=A0A395S7R1_9HYPO|nr:methionyl-trna formyltransferase [Fusarium longipes]